jgi:hypothetical protein
MGLWDKLKQAGRYPGRLRRSIGPDSYFQYERERNYEREQADRAVEHADDSAEREREKAERARDYEARYASEREGDTAEQRAERPEDAPPDSR